MYAFAVINALLTVPRARAESSRLTASWSWEGKWKQMGLDKGEDISLNLSQTCVYIGQ